LEGKIVGLFLIVLIGGLIGGFGLSYIIYQPQVQNLQNNQVQVSGTISENQPSEIVFSSFAPVNGSYIQTSSLIINGRYSVVLVGGISYSVRIDYQPVGYTYPTSRTYSLYVPLGVTTFTANF
jgi:predicted small secreted protein